MKTEKEMTKIATEFRNMLMNTEVTIIEALVIIRMLEHNVLHLLDMAQDNIREGHKVKIE